jgi:hypothetical protein
MKKILFLFFIFYQISLFAQKDTLTLVVAQAPNAYTDKKGSYFKNLDNGLEKVIKTTHLIFFADNLGIKAEFVKCYMDTSVVKSEAQKEEVVEMIKRKYVAAQTDFLKINQQFFPYITGTDIEKRTFDSKAFLGKTTVVGVHSGFRNDFLEPMFHDLDSIAKAFPNVNVAMMSDAMEVEIQQTLHRQKVDFQILANAGYVCGNTLGWNYPLSYFVILDKNGKIKDMIFIYDSSGVFSFDNSGGYNVYNLEMIESVQKGYSFFQKIKKKI